MFRILVLALALALPPTLSQAAEVTSFELDNGMQVVVLEDHRAPVVVHMVWYKVGAADEPPGKSGIAHFLEHLLFKGTDDLAAGELSATVARNGGSDNAFTGWDYTAYFQRIAADRLELMMQMESDRMRNLQMTEEDVRTERDVVLEERNQRIDSEPGALFSEQGRAAQYLNHPYGIPIIGWRHEIEQLNRDDAFAFYKRYYAPNNAILVVAGDVAPDAVRALADSHYGPIAPTPDLSERVRPAEPPQLVERRLAFSDARVSQPYVNRTYLVTERNSGDQQEAARLTLLAQLLGGSGATSVLARKLQFESQQAVYSTVYYDDVSLDESTFGLIVVPTPGTDLKSVEGAMDQAISEFLDEGIDAEHFERLKFQIKASQIYADDNIQSLARKYGEGLASGLTIEDIEGWTDILMAVTAEEVIETAQGLFDKRKAVTGWIMPAENGEVIQ